MKVIGKRIGMFPSPFQEDFWNRECNPYLPCLAQQAKQNGFEIFGISLEEMLSPMSLTRQNFNLLHFHWPDSILTHFLIWGSRSTFRNLSGLSKDAIRHLNSFQRRLLPGINRNRVRRAISGWLRELKKTGLPILWQQHEITCHAYEKDTAPAAHDIFLRRGLFECSAALVLHEHSCKDPVFEFHGMEKPYGMVPLMDYVSVHGKPVSRDVARDRLNIPRQARLLSYLGTPRPRRSPEKSYAIFSRTKDENARMLVAGNGVAEYLPSSPDSRVTIYSEILPNDLFRDILCASDFIINDGQAYLTSAVVRAAMSYGVPVIAGKFGATMDMAKGALVEVSPEPDGLEKAIGAALTMDEKTCEAMRAEAAERNAERSAEVIGTKLAEIYQRAQKAK